MNHKQTISVLAAAGVLFAGFLTFKSMILNTCTGGCSYLAGYPTCLYGLVMFLTIFIASLLKNETANVVLKVVAVCGVIFSLYYIVQEFSVCVFCYWLGFPNCVYGMLVYAAIAWLAFSQSPITSPSKRGRNL